MFQKLRLTLEAIKIQHTLFALPFAALGMMWAQGGWPAGDRAAWILAAMVTARSSAMAFNRLVDRRFDAANPRTADRALPRGLLSPAFVAGFALAMAALFVVAASRLNDLCFRLSPVALVVVLGYSFTKRFTWLSHFVLGLGLGLAPVGAWLAVDPAARVVPGLLGAAVLLWVAGFDVLYACEDEAFDRRTGLHSIPARFGVRAAMAASAVLHFLALAAFVGAGILARMGPIYYAGCGGAGLLLVYEHLLVGPRDLRRLNSAFFYVNVLVSLLLAGAGIVDLYW